jgi:amidase
VIAKVHRHVLELRAAYNKALEEVDVLITLTALVVASKRADVRPEAESGSSVMDKAKLAVGVTTNKQYLSLQCHRPSRFECVL